MDISPLKVLGGPHFVAQPILLVKTFLIFDINHQLHDTRRSIRLNDKNDNANYALVSHGFTNGSGCHF